MDNELVKSCIRALLATTCASLGTLLATDADLTLKVALVTVGAAALPVLARYLDPQDAAFGRGSSEE